MTTLPPLPKLRGLLAAIPSKRWMVGDRGDEKEPRCVIGHLQTITGTYLDGTSSVFKRFKPLVTSTTFMARADWALADINNGHDPRYRQRSPRGRVLAAMDDLIARKVPQPKKRLPSVCNG